MQGDASDTASLLLCSSKAVTLDNPVAPAFQLLQSLQKLASIIYLTKLDAGNEAKVRDYMTEAEAELGNAKQVVLMLAKPTTPHQEVNSSVLGEDSCIGAIIDVFQKRLPHQCSGTGLHSSL